MRRQQSAWVHSRRKRAIDIICAGLVLPVAIPIAGVAAAVSALAFRSNPIFKQERQGRNGSKFFVYKVRSLPSDFPRHVGKHDLGRLNLPLLSRLIRASHADELPQFVNVLRGEMSLVGPRPMIDDVLARVPADLRAARQRVLPGITGVWQVSTMGGSALHECPDLDAMYVEHGSLALDVKYLVWTVARKASGDRRRPDALRADLRRHRPCSCVGCRPLHPVPDRTPPVVEAIETELDDAESTSPKLSLANLVG